MVFEVVLPVLFFEFFFDLFSDFTLVLKIFVFMSIVSFVKQHVGNNILALLVTIVFSWYALFVAFALFGTIYLLYTLLAMGMAGILIDYFFVSNQQNPMPPEDGPVSSGFDIAQRMKGSHPPHMPGR